MKYLHSSISTGDTVNLQILTHDTALSESRYHKIFPELHQLVKESYYYPYITLTFIVLNDTSNVGLSSFKSYICPSFTFYLIVFVSPCIKTQDRQSTYNVTLGRIHVTIVAVEKQSIT